MDGRTDALAREPDRALARSEISDHAAVPIAGKAHGVCACAGLGRVPPCFGIAGLPVDAQGSGL